PLRGHIQSHLLQKVDSLLSGHCQYNSLCQALFAGHSKSYLMMVSVKSNFGERPTTPIKNPMSLYHRILDFSFSFARAAFDLS
ncbi:hypothetical protein, partial [Shewanella indica]|uniref:hypothetical protein n=1 Tax=Shewanella indica TaxID=768528 RepID=UPI003006147C